MKTNLSVSLTLNRKLLKVNASVFNIPKTLVREQGLYIFDDCFDLLKIMSDLASGSPLVWGRTSLFVMIFLSEQITKWMCDIKWNKSQTLIMWFMHKVSIVYFDIYFCLLWQSDPNDEGQKSSFVVTVGIWCSVSIIK